MYTVVIFDYGQTLVESASLAATLEMVLPYCNVARPIGEAIESTILNTYKPDQKHQPDWLEVWQPAFAQYNVNFTEAIGRKHLAQFTQTNVLYPYTRTLLEHLEKSSIKVGLLSNATGPPELFYQELVDKQIVDFFNATVWSCQIGYRKPYQAAFEAVLTQLNINKTQALMVGDSEIADVEGGLKAGLDVMRIYDGDQPISKATYLVSRAEIVSQIKRLIN